MERRERFSVDGGVFEGTRVFVMEGLNLSYFGKLVGRLVY